MAQLAPEVPGSYLVIGKIDIEHLLSENKEKIGLEWSIFEKFNQMINESWIQHLIVQFQILNQKNPSLKDRYFVDTLSK